jgi:DNA-binding NtrC family response regulator
MAATTTLDLDWNPSTPRGEAPLPGVVVVLRAGQPTCAPLPLDAHGQLELGRGHDLGQKGPLEDRWMSRQHVLLRLRGDVWEVADLKSRNGTALDGQLLDRPRSGPQPLVVRAGTSLFLPRADIRPFLHLGIHDGTTVTGPALATVFHTIAAASRFGTSLHIEGESGSGKELAARAFHDLGPRSHGPFIAVNCAAIPEGVAERLLFGARKGAFSGADAHAEGYVQAAHNGTLFLDEVAELDLAVQAKLLRVLENREVLALGASRPQPVDLHICSATHKDLRAEVVAGRLREDLYYRLSRPEVRIPPLRARLEEIPLLVFRALADPALAITAHASLIEACMLRHWPGNVRELVAEVRTAARAALTEGSPQVEGRHLLEDAGQPLSAPEAPTRSSQGSLSPAEIEAVLVAEGGNVSQAARVLGLHRTQLRRLLTRHGIAARGD